MRFDDSIVDAMLFQAVVENELRHVGMSSITHKADAAVESWGKEHVVEKWQDPPTAVR
jgi:hypothetical protein